MTEDHPNYDPSAEMTLDEWLAEQRHMLALFEIYWKAQQRQDPDNHPERLTFDEWNARASELDLSDFDETSEKPDQG